MQIKYVVDAKIVTLLNSIEQKCRYEYQNQLEHKIDMYTNHLN